MSTTHANALASVKEEVFCTQKFPVGVFSRGPRVLSRADVARGTWQVPVEDMDNPEVLGQTPRPTDKYL